MKKHLSFFVFMTLVNALMAQTVTLTFTGRDTNNNYFQLDRVVITNMTKSWQETIFWPDTTLTMQAGTGIEDYAKGNTFALSQNNPNPFIGTTDANLTVVEPGDVLMEILDVNGRIVETQNFASLQIGNHRFRIQVTVAGIYFMNASQRGQSSTIKMVNNGSAAGNSIEYVGMETLSQISTQAVSQTKGEIKTATDHPFSLGDQMSYVGYATLFGNEVESQQLQQAQGASESITLLFNVTQQPIDGQPCPGAATLTDIDGNVYNTVQIGNQCWMKENLRTTKYANNTIIPLGDSVSFEVAYRYYPDSNANNVAAYGYLYNWKAVMDTFSSSSAIPSGVQGICPDGWHVPSYAEWRQLANYVKSQSQYVSPGCTGTDDAGHTYCIAKALASTSGWYESPEINTPGNNPSTNNITGFSVLPAGYYNGVYSGVEDSFSINALFWSSTQHPSNVQGASGLGLGYVITYMYWGSTLKNIGKSVRCLKD